MAFTPPGTRKVALGIPNGSGGTDYVVIDACVSEQHTLKNKLTDHPVEQGVAITDHSRPEPREVALECVQSNTPIVVAAGVVSPGDLWKRLVDLHTTPQLLTLYTVRDYYSSIAIESVTAKVDAKTAQVLSFTATLREIRVVQNKLTAIKLTKPKGQPKKDQGKISTSKSALASITDAIAGWFK